MGKPPQLALGSRNERVLCGDGALGPCNWPNLSPEPVSNSADKKNEVQRGFLTSAETRGNSNSRWIGTLLRKHDASEGYGGARGTVPGPWLLHFQAG